MRARELKPGFFTNEVLSSLPFEVRLLFAGLWCSADRCGRLEDRPRRIHAEVFPYDQTLDVDAMLWKLEEAWFIYRYTVQGSEYIQIAAFFKHQRPHPHEIPSKIPPIPCDLIDSKACRDFSRSSRDMSHHSCMVCPSGPSGPSSLQDLPTTPPQLPTQTVGSCAPLGANESFSLVSATPASNGRSKPPKARRAPVNDTWPEWKRTTWATLLREDPKREYCRGSKARFTEAIQNETQADWLVQAHRKQILDTPDKKFWPGFSSWLESALTLLDAGLSIAEVSQEREAF